MLIKKQIAISILFFLFTCLAFGQKPGSLLGEKVTNLALNKIVNYDLETTNISEFKDKIVILDFWATWCAPCIKAFPHLESLSKQFPEDLQILTITSSDSEEKIKKFLTKFKIDLPIVLDSDRLLANRFPHSVISHTVVLDKDQKIVAITTPEKITSEVIQKIIDGKDIKLQEKKDNLAGSYKDHLPSDNTMFLFNFIPYNEGIPSEVGTVGFRNGRILRINHSVPSLHIYARNIPYYRRIYEIEDWDKYSKPENLYSLEIIAPDKSEQEIRQMILSFIQQKFPTIVSKIEKRIRKVKVLKRNDEPLGLIESNPTSKYEYGFNGTDFGMINSPINPLALFLENTFQIPIIDETNLQGKYDVSFKHELDHNKISQTLKSLGLELVDAERRIDMLILYEEPSAINN